MQLQAIGSAYMYFTLPFEFRTTNWCGGSDFNAAIRSGVSAFLCTKPAAARRSPLLGASASEFAHAAARNAAPTAIKARCEGLFILSVPFCRATDRITRRPRMGFGGRSDAYGGEAGQNRSAEHCRAGRPDRRDVQRANIGTVRGRRAFRPVERAVA